MATNTAPSFTEHIAPSSGSTAGPYSISFSYIDEDEVDVTVNGVLKTKTTHYTFASATTIQFTSGNNPANSAAIKFQRDTDIGSKKVDFQDGSVLTETDLDSSTDQLLFSLQELADDYVKRDGSQTITGNLVFEGSTDDNNETTLAITDPTADRTITIPDITGTVVTTGDTGTVTSTMILNGTIVDTDVNASAAIQGTKINPNFGSQNITTTGNGSIGGTLGVTSNATVGGTLGVTGASTFTGAIDANGGATIDNIQIGVTGNNEIDTASGNLTIDSAGGTTTIDDAVTVTGSATLQSTLGVTGNATVGGTLGVTSNATVGGTLGVTGTTTVPNITGDAVVTSGTSTSDTKVYSAKRAGEIFYGKDTVEEIQSGETWSSADDKVATTAAIDARIIDLVDDVGGFVPIANETVFPDANPDINNPATGGTIVSIKEISSSRTPSSGTVTISNGNVSNNATITITGCGSTVLAAGFGVLVETTSTLHTYAFHRLVPKATEVTTVAGKATEIGRLGTADAVADMAILGTTDVVADMAILGTTDVVADMNLLATSDVVADMALLAVADVISDMNDLATSGNITAMANCSNSITSINTASSNLTSINNFGDKYQVAANNPSTDGGGNALAAGDLYFNTSANELKVYNGSSWQAGVTATGNFATTTGNTFTGDNTYNDGVKALFGAGSDLQILHDSSTPQNLINSFTSNPLTIMSNGDTSIKSNNNENMGVFKKNGAVELYHNNVKKFETASFGVRINDSFYVDEHILIDNDTGRIKLGIGADLQIYHDGSNSYIEDAGTGELRLRGTTIRVTDHDGSENFANFIDNGAVELFYDNSKKFETNSNGGQVSGRLTVRGANDTTFDHVGVLNLTGTDAYNSGNAGSGINFVGVFNSSGNTTQLAQISGIKEDTGDGTYDGALTFGVRNDAEGVNIERVRITSAGNLRIPKDNARFQIGASQDLEFYHNGSNSYIENNTGNFVIDNQGVDMYINSGNDIYIRPQAGENGIKAIGDGGVELYYDASKKFETKSTGGQITGQLQFGDGGSSSGNNMASFGSSDDLKIYHDGTHSYIQNHTTGNIYNRARQEWHVRCNATDGGADDAIIARQNGGVELYYDHVKKFETTNGGVEVASGNSLIIAGTDGSSYIQLKDNAKLYMGTGNDLQIYHDGSHSRIHNTTGNLYLRANDGLGVFNGDGSETLFEADTNGAVKLYYDHVKRFETNSGGVEAIGIFETTAPYNYLRGNSTSNATLTLKKSASGADSIDYLQLRNNANELIGKISGSGDIIAGTNNQMNLGSSSVRWANVYTNDLNLSNEGSKNDVDGTWGSYTIQEGAESLFLINKRNGKKYMFNLTEVS